VALCDPPRVERGDLRCDLAALAKEAPSHATLVIFHTAVLAYVPDPEDRIAFANSVHELGAQWISNESANLLNGAEASKSFNMAQPWGKFLLSLNGKPIAYTDAHGTAIEWFSTS